MAPHAKEDLVFYYSPYSTAESTFDVLTLLEVPHTLETVDLKNKPAKLQSLNPNSQVPTLVYRGVSVYETAACCIYLGETFGVEKGLYPALSPERGQALSWIVWATADLAAGASKLMYAKDEAAKKEGREKTIKCLQILDQHLGESGGFVVGKSITIVDVQLAAFVHYITFLDVDASDMKAVTKWHQTVADRLKKIRDSSAQ